jgi:hypothetical protein
VSKNGTDIPADARRALAALETEDCPSAEDSSSKLKRIRFSSKLAALNSLAKHLGIFIEKPASGSHGLTIHLCDNSERHEAPDQPEWTDHPLRLIR